MVYATATESKSEEHPGKKGEPLFKLPLIAAPTTKSVSSSISSYSVYPGFCCSSG